MRNRSLLKIVSEIGYLMREISREKKQFKQYVFIVFVVFSLLYAEFAVGYSSGWGPIEGLGVYIDPRGNEIERAIGEITITDYANILIKGTGRYWFKVMDSEKRVLMDGEGFFNSSGYAEIRFTVSPKVYDVGAKYRIEVDAIDEPFPFIVRSGKIVEEIRVRRDIAKLEMGYYKENNKTIIIARLQDESAALAGQKIEFHYKEYGTNESFSYLGEGVTDKDGFARISVLFNDSKIYLVKAEFKGDELYEAVAMDLEISPILSPDDFSRYNRLLNILKNQKNPNETYTVENNQNTNHETKDTPKNQAVLDEKDKLSDNKVSIKTTFSAASELKKNNHELSNGITKSKYQKKASSRDVKKNTSSKTLKVKFSDEDVEKMTLVDFLEKLTDEDSPASLLIDIAEIINNIEDVPYVVYKLGIVLSKLDIALIPIADGDGILLYKVQVIEEVKKVARTITEIITETVTTKVKKTKTIFKRVTKWVKSWEKVIKWVRIKKTYRKRVWYPFIGWKTVTITVYAWKLKINWKAVWKKVTKTVKKTITYWTTVTRTVKKTVKKTVYDTVKERKEVKTNVYKIYPTSFKVKRLSDNTELSFDAWILSLIGIKKDVLTNTVNFLLQKTLGPVLGFVNQVIDFLIEWGQRFLKHLVDSTLSYIWSMILGAVYSHSEKSCSYKKASIGFTDPRYSAFSTNIRFLLGAETRKLATTTEAGIKFGRLHAWTYEMLGIKGIAMIPLTSHHYVLYWDKNNKESNLFDAKFVNMRGYESFSIDGKYVFFPFGMSKTYTFVITVLKDKNGRIKYDSKGNPVFGYIPIEIITVEGNDAIFYDSNYVKTLPSDVQKQVKSYYKDLIDGLNDVRELKGLDSVNFEDINTYGKLRNILSETFDIDVRAKIQDALKYNGIIYDRQRMTFGDKITPLDRPEYYSDVRNDAPPIPKYPKYPVEELALIKHDDGTETAVFTMKEYDSWFINYTSRDNRKGPNFTKDVRRVMMDLFDIEDLDIDWRYIEKRDEILSNKFDHSAIPFMKEYFQNIKKIAEERNYKLDHYSGYLLLFTEMDIKTKKGNAKIVGQVDPYLSGYGNTFIAAPGEVRPDIVAATNYLSSEYRHMMKIYQRTAFGSKRKTGWNDNRKIALLTRAALINTMRIAILLQLNPDTIKYKVEYITKNGKKESRMVSLREIYDASQETLKKFYKNEERRDNTKTLFDDRFKVKLGNIEVTLGDIISSFVGIPVDDDGNVHLITFNDESDSSTIVNKLTDEPVELALEEVMGFAEPMKAVIREVLDYDLPKVLDGSKDISFAQARFLAEFIGTNIGHHIIVEALKLYSRLRTADGLNPKVISSLYRNILTEGRYLVMIKAIDEKIKELDTALEDAKKNGDKDLVKKHKELLSKCHKVKEALEAQLTLNRLKRRLEDLKAKRNSDGTSAELRFHILKAYSIYSIFKIKMALKELITKENIKNGIEQAEILSIVAPVIFFAVFDLMQLAFEKDPKFFANFVTDNNTIMLTGIALTVIVLVVFNGIDERLDFGSKAEPGVEIAEPSTLFKLLNPVVLTGTIISSVGMFLRLFGAPFYQGKELVYKIGEIIGDHINNEAEMVWDTIAGYELPLVEQTVFETAVNLALGGWRDALMEILISSITAVINNMLSTFVKPLIANLAYETLMTSEFF